MTRIAIAAWSIVAFGAVTAVGWVLLHRQLIGDPAPVRYPPESDDGLPPADVWVGWADGSTWPEVLNREGWTIS